MMSTLEQLKKWFNEAEAIVIGAGAGLSTAAGFEYDGKTFLKHFDYMHDLYGYNDMYSAGFHNFLTEEEKWGYWSKFIYLNRYQTGALPLYHDLLKLVAKKNYFVITTNVDHQFQKAGFSKERLFYTQGDYGLFQCSIPCHQKTYDNEDIIKQMITNQIDHKISSDLLPKCPICHHLMTMNLRSDENFVEDEGWHKASDRYLTFLKQNISKNILFIELGVGWNTPSIIKIPFMQMVKKAPHAHYLCINKGHNEIIDGIEEKAIILNQDLKEVITILLEELSSNY